MDSKKLVALLSSLISKLLLLLLLLIPSSSLSPNPTTNNSSSFHSDSNSYQNFSSIIQHFISSQEIASSLYLLSISRKRKRTHSLELDFDPTRDDGDAELGHRLSDCRVGLCLIRSPDSFKSCFKMTSSTFEWLAGLLEPLLDCRDPVGSPINLSAELRLGIGLTRLATGSSYPEIARRFGVTESVTRFCAKQLCRVLCTNFRFWVGFPSSEELKSVSKSFEEISGLPNCCGVVDCTRFEIVINEKSSLSIAKEQDDSIAAQIVVDSSSRILSIVAGFRGDKGDSRVLKLSSLYKDIELGKLLNSNAVDVNGVEINQYLIGDGGYPLLPWLMVPFVDVISSCEQKFNVVHNLMRVPALKTIASLKNWGVLSKPIEEEIRTAVAFIGACSILHNVLLMREDDSALHEALVDYSVHDQSSQYFGDASLEEKSVERQASVIRSALATRARVTV